MKYKSMKYNWMVLISGEINVNYAKIYFPGVYQTFAGCIEFLTLIYGLERLDETAG
jgi:hypothetical protein